MADRVEPIQDESEETSDRLQVYTFQAPKSTLKGVP